MTELLAARFRILVLTSKALRVVACLSSILAFWITLRAQTQPTKADIPRFGLGIELKSDAGPSPSDLNPFLTQVFKAVKNKALATMPKSVSQGDQGLVSIQLQIQRDGTLVSPAFPKVAFSSGKKVLDDHAMAAILHAAPFDHLPESCPAPVALQLTFYYNLSPPK